MNRWTRSAVGAGTLIASGGLLVIGAGRAGATSVPSGCHQSGTTVTCSFGYTGSQQTFVVPSGTTSISAKLIGASGANAPAASSTIADEEGQGATYPTASGGLGAVLTTTITVTPGQTLYLFVGGAGSGSTGGFNGGGAGGTTALGNGQNNGDAGGGGGGGGTDIRTAVGSNTLESRLAIAGGGGGAGADGFGDGDWSKGGAGGNAGAAGGTPAANDSGDAPGASGGAGQMSTGGAGGAGGSGSSAAESGTSGSNGVFGVGGAAATGTTDGEVNPGTYSDAGGGGGGCYGGGGGGSGATDSDHFSGTPGGGGGGSSCVAPLSTQVQSPARVTAHATSVATSAGNGSLTISYTAAAVTTTTTATTLAQETTTSLPRTGPILPITGPRDVSGLLETSAGAMGLGALLVAFARRRVRRLHRRR